MSRVGKKSITIPSGVTAVVADRTVRIKGAKGELKLVLHPHVNAVLVDGEVQVTVQDPEEKRDRALWGLFRNLIANMVEGVTNGFTKQLEINGVGYRVALTGRKLTLDVGYSHPVEFALPEGIEAIVDKNTIKIHGADKYLVGEIAAQLRRVRLPEPYKGKGIKYADEVIRRKAGKAVKSATA